MSHVWIYGDSYSDPDYPFGEYAGCWLETLGKEYRLHNYSLAGTGPDYSIEQMMKNLSSVDKDDCLIFVVSWPARFNLKNFYRSDKNQVNSTHIDHVTERIKTEFVDADTGVDFLRNIFKYQYPTNELLHIETLKHISLINSLSNRFKRILIWPVEDTVYSGRLFDNVTLVEQGIGNISYNDHPHKSRLGTDPRRNHLSLPNHNTMYNQLKQWIDHGTAPDTTQFVSCFPDPA